MNTIENKLQTATQNLEHDHEYVIQLTHVMIRMTQLGATDTNHLKSVVHIIKNFADGLHHKKEEDLLFPLFEQRSAGGHCAPVGVMLMEHDQGRAYVKGMVNNIALYENGNKEALQSVYENMLGYAYLLQNHIEKENNVLFRMADVALTVEDQQNLIEKFTSIEAAAEEGNRKDDFIGAIAELDKFYEL